MLVTKTSASKFYKLWLPILGAILTQFSFSITDSIMIAPFGEKYLGGVGIAGIYYTVTLVFFNGFIDIFSNLFSRKQAEHKNNIISLYLTLVFIIITATTGAFLTLLFSNLALSYFGLSSDVLEVTANHLKILSYGVCFSISYYACVILLRVLGKANTTFFIVLCGSLANISGNWILLYGPLSGIFSPENAVAWTTILSRCLMFIITLINVIKLLKSTNFSRDIIFPHLREAISHYIFILRKGTPRCARNLNDWLGSFILVLFIGHFGTSCSAANQATDIISSAMYMFTQASCTTIGILFSRWIGENASMLGSRHEIKKMAIFASMPSLFVCISVFFLRDFILDAFSLTPGTYARNLAETILIIHLLTLPIYITQHLANSFLDAMFDTKIPSLFALFITYAFILPIAFVGVNILEYPPYAIWIVDSFGMLLISLFLAIRLFAKTKIYSENNVSPSVIYEIQ